MVFLLKKNSLLISAAFAIFTFVILIFLSFNFNIKPGSYSFVEVDEYLTISNGILHKESIKVYSDDNPLRNTLITTTIKEIDIFWSTILLMMCYLLFLILKTRIDQTSIKNHVTSLSIALIISIRCIYKIIDDLIFLTDFNIF